MMQTVSRWMSGLVCASVISGIALAVTPQGKGRKAVRFAGGLLLLAAFIKPLLDLKPQVIPSILTDYRYASDKSIERFKEENERLLKELIESDTAAYILDKAEELGIKNCSVSISAIKGDGDYPYPHEVWVTSDADRAQSGELSEYISRELGIEKENQHWSFQNGY